MLPGQPRRDSHAADTAAVCLLTPRQTAIRHADGIGVPGPTPATLSSPGTPRALAGPAALTGTIRAVRCTFQPGHLVVDRMIARLPGCAGSGRLGWPD